MPPRGGSITLAQRSHRSVKEAALIVFIPDARARLPNEKQISCKRPMQTYVPYRLKERLRQRNSGRPAFVGCICGLGGSRVDPSTPVGEDPPTSAVQCPFCRSRRFHSNPELESEVAFPGDCAAAGAAPARSALASPAAAARSGARLQPRPSRNRRFRSNPETNARPHNHPPHHEPGNRMFVSPPNEKQISCKRS